MRRQLQHTFVLLLGALGAIGAALAPRVAWAACGPTDLGACAADAQYSLWYTVASFGWLVDSMLLALAYQLHALRAWVVEVVFTSAYATLTGFVGPLVVPLATLAALLAVLSVLVLPIWGRVRGLSIHNVLVWALLAPLVLSASGPWLVQLDQARATVAADVFQQVGAQAAASTPLFGAQGSDMRAPQPLYPSDPCGTGTLDPGTGVPRLGVDTLAASLLEADAGDVHCAAMRGPSSDIPDAFYLAPPSGPGFAFNGSVGDLDEPQRSGFVQGIQRGSNRLWLGVIPCALAVVDALIQLLFSLALVGLWAGLPFALLVVFFQERGGAVVLIGRRALGVVQVSWSSSILLGIVFACLTTAAALRNAAAFVGFATGALLLYSFVLVTAIGTLLDSLRTLRDVFALATGLDAGRPVQMAGAAVGMAAGAGAALVTGGASAALTATAAYQATGSGRYAASAAVGRISERALRVGEVAASLGAADGDGEVVRGLEAGARGRGGARALHNTAYPMRRQMQTDAQQANAIGQTFAEQAAHRGIARDLRRFSRAAATSAVSHTEGGMQFAEQRSDDGLLPLIQSSPAEQVNQARLLQLGYSVQANGNEVRFWKNEAPTVDPARPFTPARVAYERAQERLDLITGGGLRGDVEHAHGVVQATKAAYDHEVQAQKAKQP